MKFTAALRLFCVCAVLVASGPAPRVLAQTDTPAPSDTPAPTTTDTAAPTTFLPGTVAPATDTPAPTTTDTPTPTTTDTAAPTTAAPTTAAPTTAAPTTAAPTTAAPTTAAPTTAAPTTAAPTTAAPTTAAPTTTPPPTTAAPTPAPIYFTPTTTVNGTLVCGPRVRRSWATLNPVDKQLYLDAVNASMVLGYHALFVEVHSQYESGCEAHRSCGFLYWHRRYLYAYESMLRSLEPRFACLTVPYWDYYSDFAKKMSGACSTFEGCSMYLQDMGGSTGPAGSNTINGITTTGNCPSAPFLSNYCQSSSASGSSCNRCLPRSDWLSKGFPSGFGYSSLARLLSGSFGYATFSQNLQYITHNSIHNTAMGVMGTMATSADPIYYGHHATVDLVAQMFYECQVGRDMTELEKKTSTYAFQQCVLTSSDVCPTVLANMTMQVGSNVAGQPFTKVEDHPMLSPFFSPLPKQYWQWVSGTDMGAFSYTYEKDVLFGYLNSSGLFCPKNKVRRNLATTTWSTPTMLTPTTFHSDTDVRTKSVIKTFKLFQNVFGDALYATSFNRDKALEQVELMECQYYQDRFGSVDDFTPEFRANFGVPPTIKTTCARRIQELATGAKAIGVSGWEDTFAQHLEV